MALIKCSECGKKISDKASVCIYCGCPIEYNLSSMNTNEDVQIRKIRGNSKYKAFLVGTSIGCTIIAVIVFLFLVIIPSNHYNNAVSLMDKGQYQEAINVFEQLDDYKDSSFRLIECKYNIANFLMSTGQYQEAITIFESLVAYKDSKDNLIECKYRNAITLMNAGQCQEAIAVFEILGDYKDCKNHIIECKYIHATTLIDAGHYQEAKEIFDALDGYKDSIEKMYFCQQGIYYNEIVTLSKTHPAKAAIAFAKMGDFLDAKTCSRELWDQTAIRKTVSAGASHTVAIKEDKSMVAVGSNSYNECDVDHWTDIIAVSAGRNNNYTVGLKADGTVVVEGRQNAHQACSTSDWTDIVAISTYSQIVGLKADGTVVACCDNSRGQCNVDSWTDIIAVDAGGYHTVGLKSDGTVVAVGNNSNGTCNVNSWTDIIAIGAGTLHTVGLKADGTVVTTGENYYGQNNVNNWSNIIAISVGAHYTVGLKADGTVVACGDNTWGQCNVDNWTDIIAISAGHKHVVALKADGTVVATGYNVHGECDVGDWSGIQTTTTSVSATNEPSTNDTQQEPESNHNKNPDNITTPTTEHLTTESETPKTSLSFNSIVNIYSGKWYLDGYANVYLNIFQDADGWLQIYTNNFYLPDIYYGRDDGIVYPFLSGIATEEYCIGATIPPVNDWKQHTTQCRMVFDNNCIYAGSYKFVRTPGTIEKIFCLSHQMHIATCQIPSTCTLCGYTEGTPVECQYIKGVCHFCGAEANEPPVTEPTVTESPIEPPTEFTEPLVTEPPMTEPPTTEPPITEPTDDRIITGSESISNETINGDVYITSTGVAMFSNVTVNGNVYCYGKMTVSGGSTNNLYAYYWDLGGITASCDAWDGTHGFVKGTFSTYGSVIIKDYALDYAFNKWGKQ